MPAIVSNLRLQTHRRALDIPRDVIEALQKDPRANILYAGIEKAISKEREGTSSQHEELWIASYTHRPGSNSTIDFVLSCTYGVIGEYPIFIYSTKSVQDLTDEFIEPRIYRIVQELDNNLSTRKRVYSIFASRPVSRSFARHWTQRTGIQIIREPYYDATFSYCTSNTLALPPSPDSSCRMRLAERHDIPQVAQLCKGFSEESPPFVLDDREAHLEASTLVGAQQLWVLEITHSSTIACIVALTRTTGIVAAVTKVYTPPRFRQRGYARRLVQHVSNVLLRVKGKQYVVLYVGNENPAAHVYHRVGFQGLKPQSDEQDLRVEPWLEIGFDRSKVNLGQW